MRSWNGLTNKSYIPKVPFRKVKVCIVLDGIEELKAVGRLTPYNSSVLRRIAQELYATNGVKLRSMGNLQMWEKRGVLLCDPSVMPSKSLTEIISKLNGYRTGVHFILIGETSRVYEPLLRSREEGNTLHVTSHPMKRGSSFVGSGIFKDLRHIDWSN